MDYTIKKHAKGKYLVKVFQLCWKMSDPVWLPFKHVSKFPEYSDIRKEINFLGFPSDKDVVSYSFSTDEEILEIIVDILADNKYYDLTELRSILNDIKLLES